MSYEGYINNRVRLIKGLKLAEASQGEVGSVRLKGSRIGGTGTRQLARWQKFSGLNRCLLSKEKNHSSTTSDLLSPNYTTVARKTSLTLPQAQKVLRHIEQGFSRMFNRIRSSAQ